MTVITKNYTATTALAAFLIAKHGANDGEVAPAAAASDKLIGVSTGIDSAVGEPCDVIHLGVAPVLAGGSITRGDLLTSDGNGKAIAAAPSAGANARIVGMALVSASSGDIFSAYINPCVMQG